MSNPEVEAAYRRGLKHGYEDQAKLPSAGYSDLERYLHVCHVNGVEPSEAKVRAIIGAERDALQAKLDRVRELCKRQPIMSDQYPLAASVLAIVDEESSDQKDIDPFELIARYEAFLEWLIDLDNPDPESAGFQRRRRITLNAIIKKARITLGVA